MTEILQLNKRFRGFLPVVVDVETGGLNPQTDALLEIAAVLLDLDEQGRLVVGQTHAFHVQPFSGAHLDPAALAFNKIDPDHPFRFALPETEVLPKLFKPIRTALDAYHCQRAVLVGHNAWFDLLFLKAAIARANITRHPFHAFTCFDTASLAGLTLGQTVLIKAAVAAGIEFDQEEAHSAIYDAQKTAELFCYIVNHTKVLT
ncbi:MAG: ribonuclease T [Legionellales bacterium]|nr:ribonuclease T [Legionellales bacterium]